MVFSFAIDRLVKSGGKHHLPSQAEVDVLEIGLHRDTENDKIKIAQSPVAAGAFPSRLTSLSKQRKSTGSHRASLYLDVNQN